MRRIYERHHTEVPCGLVLYRLFADAGAGSWLNYSMIIRYGGLLLFFFTISVGNRNVPYVIAGCAGLLFRGQACPCFELGKQPLPRLSLRCHHSMLILEHRKVSVTPPARNKMLLFCSV